MCAYVYLRRAGRNDGFQLRYAECDNYLTAKEGQRLQEKLGLVTLPRTKAEVPQKHENSKKHLKFHN